MKRFPIYVGALVFAISGCTEMSKNIETSRGPAITDIVTPFDVALTCLDGIIAREAVFGVGRIPDNTGLRAETAGSEFMITAGAGDIVQSALFKAGVTVVNRRDMGTSVMESQWGIRDLSTQRPAMFVITGSISSLDFVPASGFQVIIGGFGSRARMGRVIVGLDMTVTNTSTGVIVANVALTKQIVARETGFEAARVINSLIVDLDLGLSEREALSFALREMLQFATFELLIQMMPVDKWQPCADDISPSIGHIVGPGTSADDRTDDTVATETEELEQAPDEIPV
jgi:curli biogenesis system outer membrane secretion channel CsgG